MLQVFLLEKMTDNGLIFWKGCRDLYSVPEKRHKMGHVLLKMVFFLLLFIFLISTGCAVTVVELDQVSTPQGAVILIVDGLSSYYFYPEHTPHAIDGTVLDKAETYDMLEMFAKGSRVLDVTAPQTFTEGGHSVMVTGYANADRDIVSASGTTIYDVAHEYGYMNFAIMQRGNSASIRSKQNVIIYDARNSVNEPELPVETYMLSDTSRDISFDVVELFQQRSAGLQSLLDEHPRASQERYDVYNVWPIETAIELIDFMGQEHPDQQYILTINVGGIDTSGHYRKDSGYIASIEGIEDATIDLYEQCLAHDMAFVFTSDHGMGFPTLDSRGGHQSERYSRMPESQKIPLVFMAEDVNIGVLDGQFGQEDIALTLLEILNIPGRLRAADGNVIPVQDYVNLKVSVAEYGNVILLKDDKVLFQNDTEENILFLGLDKDSYYNLKFNPASDPTVTIEESIYSSSSSIIDVGVTKGSQEDDTPFSKARHILGGALIGLVNLTGFLMIRKVIIEE